MGTLLFCDYDEEGKITESLVGERVIPSKQYMCFFFLLDTTTNEVLSNLPQYRIVNGELASA